MCRLRQQGCSFLVAGRKDPATNTFKTLQDVQVGLSAHVTCRRALPPIGSWLYVFVSLRTRLYTACATVLLSLLAGAVCFMGSQSK